MDKIDKALKKFSPKEKRGVKLILSKLTSNSPGGLKIKKLKGRDNIFRVRKGKIRIIYRTDKDDNIYLLAIERRPDNTYKLNI